jgi:hypothetical protein
MTITLATLHLATEQEVFEQVAKHLLKQNSKSGIYLQGASSDMSCRYRGLDGLSCAAGCLMSEEEFNYNMEGKDWFGVVNARYAPDVHKYLIFDLQNVHDNWDVVSWKEFLIKTAQEYKLDHSFIQ